MNVDLYLAVLDVETAVRLAKQAAKDGLDGDAAALARTAQRALQRVERLARPPAPASDAPVGT